jgi:hypothetical protein
MAARNEAGESTAEDTRQRRGPSAAQVRAQIVGLAAGIIQWGGLLFAVVLLVHVILIVGHANQANGITVFIKNWADAVVLGFKDLFTPADARLRVLANDGIAAVFWLVVTAIVARLLRRAA